MVLVVVITGCNYKTKGTPNKKDEEDITTSATTGTTAETISQEATSVGSNEEETTIKPVEKKKTQAVIMIYMIGSDLESEKGLASLDIEQMMKSSFDEEKINVIICTGGTSEWSNKNISNDGCNVYEITSGNIQHKSTLKSKKITDSEAVTQFADYVYENYLSENYAFVFWGNGTGAIKGIGSDSNNEKDNLGMSEMKKSFADMKLIKDGKKLKMIGFDANLMGTIEVACMLTPYAEYMVASEELVSDKGWDYNWLKSFGEGNRFGGYDMAQTIIDAYEKSMTADAKVIPDYSLSCLKLSETKNVLKSFEELILVANGTLHEGGYAQIATRREKMKLFGTVEFYNYYDMVDMYSFADNMVDLHSAEAKALQEALVKFVVYNKTNIENASGVSVYFPFENVAYIHDFIKMYEDSGFSELYVEFVKSFATKLTGGNLTNWNISQTVPSADDAGNYIMNIPAEYKEHYLKSEYSVWEINDEGKYLCRVISEQVTLSEENVLKEDYPNKLFCLVNGNGDTYNCCAVEYENTVKYIKYTIPVYISSSVDANKSMADIHIKVDKETNKITVMGIYETVDSETFFSKKVNTKLSEGMIIQPYYYAMEKVLLEDGSEAPFGNWNAIFVDGAQFSLNGDISVKMTDMETSKCLHAFGITDTQNSKYYSNGLK